jgi:3-oxoacyl-[acyl-carrier protein] reductase
MIDYGLKDKVAIITGANNPWGIGATTAIAFAREGAKVVLVYKKVDRPFDATKMDRNGVDRYYGANAGNADAVEFKLKEMGVDIGTDVYTIPYAVKQLLKYKQAKEAAKNA